MCRHLGGLPDIVIGLLDSLLSAVVAEAETGDLDDREILRRQLALATERRGPPPRRAAP